jgi:hypothetical protein
MFEKDWAILVFFVIIFAGCYTCMEQSNQHDLQLRKALKNCEGSTAQGDR